MALDQLRDVSGAHIVFCSMNASTVRLDCVAETGAWRGWPFTIVLKVPVTAEWASAVAMTLGRWANESRCLELEIKRAPDARLCIRHGETALRLDVIDVLMG